MKLLVVDDQGPVGEIISRIATQSGWEAFHSVSAERLDERIRHHEIDVLLLDYAVDGNPWSARNGLTVLRQLRDAGITIPVILFSGWSNLIDEKAANELGVLCVLEKPLGIKELRAALAEAKRKAHPASADNE